MTRYLLVVDDEPIVRTVARLGLERVGGWRVEEADSGDQAIDMIGRDRPDAVLLDVMMPGDDGPTTLHRLRALDVGNDVPVLFLTAKVQRRELDRLAAMDVHGVIGKPFDPMTLATEVATRLGWETP